MMMMMMMMMYMDGGKGPACYEMDGGGVWVCMVVDDAIVIITSYKNML